MFTNAKDAINWIEHIERVGEKRKDLSRMKLALEILGNPDKIAAYKDLLKKNNIEISAISCHGNPLHPQKEIAENYNNQFELFSKNI